MSSYHSGEWPLGLLIYNILAFHGIKRIWMNSRHDLFRVQCLFAIMFQERKELFTYISARFLPLSEVPNMY